jgi:hypothetical protein
MVADGESAVRCGRLRGSPQVAGRIRLSETTWVRLLETQSSKGDRIMRYYSSEGDT